MTPTVLELAREIESKSGFVIPERGLEPLAELASERAAALGLTGVEEYVARLRAWPDSSEWRRLLSRITIKDSRLFRGRPQFDALAETVIPELVAGRPSGRLSIWSAGCARGEEAATLAVVLAEHPLLGGWQFSILATDVDEAALSDAERGFYGPRAMASVPHDLAERYFERRGDRFRMRPETRRHIRYRHLNLAARRLDLPEAPFDLIFLRNVLIYFRPEVQRRVVASVEGVLAAGGCLFLGPSESLLPLDVALRARDLGSCFCYAWETPRAGPAHRGAAAPPPAEQPRPAAAAAEPGGHDAAAPSRRSFEELAEALLLELEHPDPERGRKAASDLRRDYPENPAAHVLEGLAWARLGSPERALLAFRAARYLAPEMAEVRYLLGRTFADLGREGQALREYRAALAASERPVPGQAPDLTRFGVPDLATIKRRCRGVIVNSGDVEED